MALSYSLIIFTFAILRITNERNGHTYLHIIPEIKIIWNLQLFFIDNPNFAITNSRSTVHFCAFGLSTHITPTRVTTIGSIIPLSCIVSSSIVVAESCVRQSNIHMSNRHLHVNAQSTYPLYKLEGPPAHDIRCAVLRSHCDGDTWSLIHVNFIHWMTIG